MHVTNSISFFLSHLDSLPVTVAEWTACPLTMRKVSRSNPGNLPLLQACRECDQLPCWPLYSQQVSHQRWISGIHGTQVTKHTSEGSTLALKPRGDVIRSPKQGYQWPHEKDSCPPNFFFLKKKRLFAAATIQIQFKYFKLNVWCFPSQIGMNPDVSGTVAFTSDFEWIDSTAST